MNFPSHLLVNIIESMLNGLAYCRMVFDAGKPCDFIFLNVNSAFENLTGLKGVEGKPVSEVIPGLIESNRELLEIYGRVAMGGGPERFEMYVEPLAMWFSVSVSSPGTGYFVSIFDVITERKKSEQALSETHSKIANERNRLAAVMQALPVGVAILDAKGGKIQANSTFDQIWGSPCPPTRSISDYAAYQARWLETGEPVHVEEWASAQAVLKGVSVIGQIMQIVRFDGSTAVIQNSASPIRDAEGRIVGCAVAIMDISESMTRAQSLREGEERFRALASATFEGIAVTEQGRLVDANEQLLQLLGYTREEFIGLSVVELLAPEDRDRVMSNIARGIESCIEHGVICKNGTCLKVEAHGKTILDKGRPFRYTAIRDVTVRKQTEERLKQSQAQLKTFIHHAPVSIAMFDRNMNYLATSGRWLAENGRGLADLVGHNHYQVDPDLPEEWRLIHQQGLAGETLKNDEDLWVQADGSPVWKRWAVLPWTDETGAIGGIIISSEDITEHKRIEANLAEQASRLRDAGRRKDEFLAMLAHELRNPLTPIRNAVKLLKLPDLDASKFSWCREVIDRQLEHLVRLVDDLLDVSRINWDRIELKKEPLTVRDFVRTALETIHPLIDTRRQEFFVTLPAEPLWIEGDRVRLSQVLSNLLNNASKYTPEGGSLGLTVESTAEDVCILIWDTGCGIEQQDLPNLFDLFFQAERNLARSQGGLGIGLSLAQRLVAMHGGELKAFSAGRGRGSEFTVRLPRLSRPEAAAAFDSATTATVRSGIDILVVDDNRDAAESLALLLGIDGHRVRIALDGPSALDMAREEWPEAVLLDIGLPGMDGYSVAQALRQSTGDKLPIWLIALTGYGQPEIREKSRMAGFDAFLVKPIEIEALRQLLTQSHEDRLNGKR